VDLQALLDLPERREPQELREPRDLVDLQALLDLLDLQEPQELPGHQDLVDHREHLE
jgi:hypothetical protein